MKNISFSPPDITEIEIEKVIEVLNSGWLTTGKITKQFEQELSQYLGTTKTVCLNSQTAAAELTLRLLGIGPGDEVIVPAYTYTASASVIHHVGAKIVMVDTAPESFEMDYDAIENAITENTKAIIPVDLGGRMCNYSKIFKAIEGQKIRFHADNDLQKIFNRVIVCADSAHSLGSKYLGSKSGKVADFTTFSFHAVKNLTTGEGGAVTWRDLPEIDSEWIYKQYMLLSLHGQSKDALQKNQLGSWEYDIVYPAFKCNMMDIQGALGLAQLQRYNQLINRRKEIIEKYDAAFIKRGIRPMIHFDEVSESCGHLYLARVPGMTEEQRNAVIVNMAQCGIACNVHYKPLPLLTAYKNLGFDISNYPNAYKQYQNTITLPLHTLLTNDDVEYISDNFVRLVEKYL